MKTAFDAALTEPKAVAETPVAGWPQGTQASVLTQLYKTVSGPGFYVIGKIKFPNGYVAIKTLNHGPCYKQQKDWPIDIEAESNEFTAGKIKAAQELVAKYFSVSDQAVLQFAYTRALNSNTLSSKPKLQATEKWIVDVMSAALAGQPFFPAFSGYSIVEILSEP
jgi:hypothetical protein